MRQAKDPAGRATTADRLGRAQGAASAGAERGGIESAGRANVEHASRHWVWVVATAVAMCITAGLYCYGARNVIDRDPFVYGGTAKELLAGRRLYADAWMDKPPLAILVYAIPQCFAPGSYASLSLFVGMCVAVQAALYAWCFRLNRAAAVGCFLFVALFPMTRLSYTWPSTEQFSNLFVAGDLLIALLIFRHGSASIPQCLAAGALACAAFHVRQNTVLCGLLPALAVVCAETSFPRRLRGLAALVAGGLAAWGAILVVVALIGDLPGYFWTVFVYPRAYAQGGSTAAAIELSTMFWTSPTALLLFIGAALAADRPYRPLAIAAVVIGIATCLATMRNYHHYWTSSFPYVALVLGLATERLAQLGQRQAWALPSAILTVVVPAIGLFLTASYPPFAQQLRVAQAADRVAPTDATLLVSGPEGSEAIQFASRMLPAHTYCWTFQLQPPWQDALPETPEQIVAEYQADPPRVLIVAEDHRRRALAEQLAPDAPVYLQLLRGLLLENDYEAAANEQQYTVYVRRK